MDNPARIACCNICMLGDTMKVCESCPLNPGRMELKRTELLKVQRVELLTQSQRQEMESCH